MKMMLFSFTNLRVARPLLAARQLHALRPLRAETTGHAPLPTLPAQDIDATISDIAEQYAIAKDEFENAWESTQANTIYAREDQQTALEEVQRLEELYAAAVKEEGEAVRTRVGQRVREIKTAVERMVAEHAEGKK